MPLCPPPGASVLSPASHIVGMAAGAVEVGVEVGVAVARQAHPLRIWEVVSDAVQAAAQVGREVEVGVAVYEVQKSVAD